MNEYSIGEMVIINIPPNRRGKAASMHNKTGVIRGITIEITERRGKVAKYNIFLPEDNRSVTIVNADLLIKATPEDYPELYV